MRTPLSTDRWRVVLPHLGQALALSDDERGPWLASLRARDATLADDLAALLEKHEVLQQQEGFLDSTATDMPSLEGREVGAYTLRTHLGEGGMGSVWLGERSDGRYEGVAAVKLLNASLVSRDGEARFRREGSILARLEHPNIAHIIDAGVSTLGQPYLVLEHVDGDRIDRYCDARSLGVDGRVRLFLDVLAAVSHAHANLVVHRDLKPSNVLVARNGRVKLLDFGIAKLLESGGGEVTEFTRDGQSPLTPQYAAPEQLTGGDVTTATDVYALGVLLYLLLAGRHPAGDAHNSPAQLIRAIVDTEPARASDAATSADDAGAAAAIAARRGTTPGKLRGALRGDLDNIVAKALKKQPADRYASAEALAADLRRYLDQQPISARPDTVRYRLVKFVRRHRVAVAAGSVAAAGLVATTAVSIGQMREARRQRDQAVYEKKRADSNVEFQYLLLAGVGTGRVTMREMVDQGKVLLESEYSGEPRVAANIAIGLAERYGELGDYELMDQMLDRADSLAAQSGAKDVALLSRCYRARNLQHRGLGDQAAALIASIQPELATGAPADVATCLALQSALEVKAGRFDEAVATSRRAVNLIEGLDATTMQRTTALNALANALENAKQRREALEIYQQIAAMLDRTGRGKTVARNVIRNNIGIALSNLGEMTAAEPVLRETLDEHLRTNPAGDVHPGILINYCRTELFLRRLDSAATWYERLHKQAVARNDLLMQQEGASGMAQVALLQGRLDDAARWVAEHKRVHERRPSLTTVLALNGALAHARRDPEVALGNFREALRTMGYAEGKRTYHMRARLIHAAAAALDAGAPGEALEYARAAHGIAASDALTETRSAYVGEARLMEARALLATGDRAGAQTALAQSLTALRAGAGPEHPRVLEAQGLMSQLSR